MEKIAVIPGTFDPFTVGHESIIKRALPLFDQIVIAIGDNASKNSYFSADARKRMISTVFGDHPRVRIETYEGLTVDFCREHKARYILRGIRTAADFEYERAIAQVNKKMFPEIESVFLLTTPELTPVNSTIVRDIIRHQGDASLFLPKGINIKDYLD